MTPIRLTLVCQAPTAATRLAAFPADEAAEPGALAKVAAGVGRFGRVDAAWASPARAAQETAAALGLAAAEAAALREIGYGRWAGRPMEEIGTGDPAGLTAWLTDPQATPHGGEAIGAVIERTAGWMEGLDAAAGTRVVAVVSASIVRAAIVAALAAPAGSFWRLDVAPLSCVRLHRRGPTWTVRLMGR